METQQDQGYLPILTLVHCWAEPASDHSLDCASTLCICYKWTSREKLPLVLSVNFVPSTIQEQTVSNSFHHSRLDLEKRQRIIISAFKTNIDIDTDTSVLVQSRISAQ